VGYLINFSKTMGLTVLENLECLGSYLILFLVGALRVLGWLVVVIPAMSIRTMVLNPLFFAAIRVIAAIISVAQGSFNGQPLQTVGIALVGIGTALGI